MGRTTVETLVTARDAGYSAVMVKAGQNTAALEQPVEDLNAEYRKLANATDDVGQAAGGAADGGVQKLITGLKAVAGAAIVREVLDTTIELGKLGLESKATGEKFEALAGGAGEAETYMRRMRMETNYAVGDLTGMQSISKLLSMGLADNAEQAAEFVVMASRLGDQAQDTSGRISDFAMMLANQSIPRLDNYGISSGAVRDRIKELQAAHEGMSREAAFTQAVLEQGRATLERLGDAGTGQVAALDRLSAAWMNLKVAVGEEVAPVLATVADSAAMLLTYEQRLADAVAEDTQESLKASQAWEEYAKRQFSALQASGQFAGVIDEVEFRLMEQGRSAEEIANIMWDYNHVIDAAIELGIGYGETLSREQYNARLLEDTYADLGTQRQWDASMARYQAEQAELQEQRTLDAKAVMDLYTTSLEEAGTATAIYTVYTEAMRSELDMTLTAQEQTLADAQLISQAYQVGAISLTDYTAQMQMAAGGTLVLSESERQLVQDQIAAANSAQELAKAHEEAEVAAANQAKTTMSLAGSLKDATGAQIANRLAGMLDPKAMGADAYSQAVAEIGLAFGTMDAQSIALAQNMGLLAQAVQDGVIPAENADEALQMLIEDAADGEVNFTALRGEFERAPGAIEPVRRSMRNLEPAVEDVADELHNAGRGMSDIASTAPAVVNGIDQVGARSRDMTPYVGALATNMGTAATNTANFSDKLGTTQSNLLALVEGSPWTVRVNVTSGGYPEYARGGEVTAPGVALVGERGPELVSLPAGARVYSAGETRERLGTTVGPIYVNVSAGPISNAIDVRELADVVSLELAERIKMRL